MTARMNCGGQGSSTVDRHWIADLRTTCRTRQTAGCVRSPAIRHSGDSGPRSAAVLAARRIKPARRRDELAPEKSHTPLRMLGLPVRIAK
jgi:hypothetical protein